MKGMELISFQIISAVGSAKSMYIQGLQETKEGNFEEARKIIKEADESFRQGHKAHASLIKKEASGEKIEFSLLLMHAEDQLIAAEHFKLVVLEFMELYENNEILIKK